MKKLLSVIVAAGFLAGLGCGDSTDKKDKKDTKEKTSTGTPPAKEKTGGATTDKKTDK